MIFWRERPPSRPMLPEYEEEARRGLEESAEWKAQAIGLFICIGFAWLPLFLLLTYLVGDLRHFTGWRMSNYNEAVLRGAIAFVPAFPIGLWLITWMDRKGW